MSQFQSTCRFILLPSFAGLVCYACGSASKMPKPVNVSLENSVIAKSIAPPDSTPVTASTPVSVTISPTASLAYREGVNLASSAYRLSQSAISPDDWELIASRWQQAADQLKKVGAQDQHYAIAQQKIADYSRSAAQANAQIKALQQPVMSPLSRPLAAALPTPVAVSPSSVSVPVVRRLHGTPVVAVTFNQVKTYEMILDTGASRTLITRQMANELGILATERMIAATASETAVTFDIGQVQSISIGEIALANARVSIGDSVSIGLLGNDFLQGYDVTIRDREVELTIAH